MASMMAASGMMSIMRLSSAYAAVSVSVSVSQQPCACALTRTTTKWSVEMKTSRPTKRSIRCAATDDKINPPTQKNEVPNEYAKVIKEKEEGSVTETLGLRLREAMAFAGPAPETINGRLAMVGFASAVAVEMASGQDLFSQINNGGAAWFAASSAILSVASLVPLLRRGQTATAAQSSPSLFSANAETWNGRFAMLGLVALAFTEYLKGGPLV